MPPCPDPSPIKGHKLCLTLLKRVQILGLVQGCTQGLNSVNSLYDWNVHSRDRQKCFYMELGVGGQKREILRNVNSKKELLAEVLTKLLGQHQRGTPLPIQSRIFYKNDFASSTGNSPALLITNLNSIPDITFGLLNITRSYP